MGKSLSDILFGESPSAEISSRDTLQEEQLAALRDFLTSVGENVSSRLPIGDQGSPLTEQQTDLVNQISDIFGKAKGDNKAATGFLTNLVKNGVSDELFNKSVEEPLLRRFQERILPAISRGRGNDFFGSERRLQDERAREDLIQTLVSGRAKFALDNVGNQINAASGIAGVNDSFINEFNALLDSAGVPRNAQIENNKLNTDATLKLLELLASATLSPTRDTVGVSVGGSDGLLSGFVKGFGEGLGSKT